MDMTPFERSVSALLVFFLLAGLSVRVYSARSGRPVLRVAADPAPVASRPHSRGLSEIESAHKSFGNRRKRSKVALNRATHAELVALPKIGPALAKKILAARDARGGFKSLKDLLSVPGIKEGVYRAIEPYVSLEPE